MPMLAGQTYLTFFDKAEVMGYRPGPTDYYGFLHDHVTPFIDPTPYMVLYDLKDGQPPINPTFMVGSLILARREHMPLERFAYHLQTDVAYQYALGLTAPGVKIPSYGALRVFARRVVDYYAMTDVDLIHETFVSLVKHFNEEADVDTDTMRIDSVLIEVYAKELTRFQLIYRFTANVVRELSKIENVVIPEPLQHFLKKGDFNYVTYHDKKTSEEKKTTKLLADASLILETFAKDYQHLKSFQYLQRCLSEQTVVDEKGVRTMREKGDPVLKGLIPVACDDVKEDPTVLKAPLLQTPTDTEATYNAKRNEDHRGFSATLLEARGPHGPIIQDYVVRQNIVGDNKMAIELMGNAVPAKGNNGALVGDGAFSGDPLQDAVENSLRILVTTNLTGRKTPEFFADLEFNEDGIVTKCPGGHAPIRTTLYDNGSCRCHFDLSACANCPYRKDCNPDEQKAAFARTFTQKQKIRAASIKFRETDEFSWYSAFRNGIEAIFSLLRRAYGIDCIPVYGLNRITIRLGLDLLAVNMDKFYLRMMKKMQAA